MSTTVAVLGAGNAGLALAADVARRGHRVRLYNRSAEPLEPVRRHGGIWLWERRAGGFVPDFGPVELATDALPEALDGADVVLVAVPAHGHRDLAERLAGSAAPGQILVLVPGRTGGALEVRYTLALRGVDGVTVAEADTLPYACRRTGPGEVTVYGVKRRVQVAGLSAADTRRAVRALRELLPVFRAARHVLETSLRNFGAVLHPAPTLLNAARIEAGERFEYYREGITPTVAAVVEGLDAERLRVAAALGVRVPTLRQWLAHTYGVRGATLPAAVRANPAYHGIGAPAAVASRYLYEDVPTGLVPMSELGRLAGVATPLMDAVIALASAVLETDFRRAGRTLARMGLEGAELQPSTAGG
ncbi:MAG: NAD/NADP octopine/nopaline dehydrogenase family protein, partial [Clostridia bacterium]|nr:NAD/NADP octopine/nopaline dehydrogenase family protein [Clostridia bacterium]